MGNTGRSSEPRKNEMAMEAGHLSTDSLKQLLTKEVVASIVVASMIIILKHFGYLDALKTATLQYASKSHSFKGETLAKDQLDAYFIAINQDLYEEAFDQSSPLNRKILAEFLSRLGGISDNQNKSEEILKPAVIAIDFDLSPNPGSVRFEGSEVEFCDHDKQLKDTLIKLARDKDIQIVLVIPEPVKSVKAIHAKAVWMGQLLEHENIRFGVPLVFAQDGVVLKYLNTDSSFARAICRAARHSDAHRFHNLNCTEKNTDHKSVLNRGQSHCIMLSAYQKDWWRGCLDLPTQKEEDPLSLLVNRPWRDAIDQFVFEKEMLQPLNYEFTSALEHQRIIPNSNIEIEVDMRGSCCEENYDKGQLSLTAEDMKAINNNVVLIGGDYGVSDYYQTATTRLSGSEVHLAAFFSIRNYLAVKKNWLPYGLEIIVGVLFGLILHGLFAKRTHFIYQYEMSSNNATKLGLSAWALFFLLLIVIWPFIAMLGLIHISIETLDRWNIWLNPLPLLAGILVHAFWSNRSDAKGHDLDSSDFPYRPMDLFKGRPDTVVIRLICTSVVVFAVILLSWESH